MSLVTRTLANTGAPLYAPDGTLLAGVDITFTLVSSAGRTTDAWDATTHERVVGSKKVTTDSAGIFSVGLWPNSRGTQVTFYRCSIDHPSARDFTAAVDEVSGTLSWIDFMAAGEALTPQGLTALGLHIANPTGAHHASAVSLAAISGMTSVNVQAGIAELKAAIAAITGATNLSYTASPTQGVVVSDTGTDATLPAADATNAGLMLPGDFTKLAGIASGATANSADAFLLDRANHTGTQLAATISDFATAADARITNAIGTTVQALAATLTALAGTAWAANALPIGTGAGTVAQTAFAANTFPARASTGNLVAKSITDYSLGLLSDADAATWRSGLGLGTLATQSANITDYGLLSGTLAQFGATSSAQLAGVISDKTGTGALVFAGSPALTGTPTAPTAAAATNTTQIATTAFVHGEVATAVTGLLHFQGNTNCSANPNYPAAVKGDAYIVSVAGKIGGASGTSVDIGDWYIATADNAGGTEASVGTSWGHMEHNLVGALLASNNLSDLTSASTARTNLGLGSLAVLSAVDAGTLTGTTLASNVVTSSITGTSTLTSGATGAGFTVALSTSTITGILGSANGGTANGFTKFTGPTTAERTFTLPNADATLIYSGGPGGTPSSMTATNLTGTASGLTAGNVTTNANLTGVITSVGNATSIASQTGTGTKFVMDTAPTIAGGSITGLTGLAVRSTGAAFDLTLASSEVLTAGRTLSFVLGDTARTLTIGASASVSGSNTGDQTITLTGDVTGSGTGSFAATIANTAVTYAKMQNVSATSRILGRITAGAGSPEELTAANVKTILALVSSDVGLGSVTNDAQTKAAIVPNTVPSAGQLLIGNAGGTAYAAVGLSGPVSVTSAGVTAVATLNQNTSGSAASLSISGQTGLLTITGLASTSRIKTVRDAADTILELGGSYTPTGTWTSLTMVTPVLGTPTSGTLTNCTGLPAAGVVGTAAVLGANTFTGAQQLASGTSLNWNNDTFLTRRAAATIQHGDADAASPVAQTMAFQGSRGGTDTNVAAVTATIQGSLGTGTGTVGNLVFSTGTVAASGTTQHTAAARLTLNSASATFAVPLISLPASGQILGASNQTDFGASATSLMRYTTTQANFFIGGTSEAAIQAALLSVKATGVIGFSSTSAATGSVDAAFARNASNVIEVNTGTAGTYADIIARRHITAPSSANGQSLGLKCLTELTTIAAAATTDTAIQMPAGAIVLAVSVRVTTAITCTSTFTVGDSGSATRFGTGLSKAVNTTNAGTVAPYVNSSALSVRITPDSTPSDATGRVRVTIYYFEATVPTS